jgi:hypothetical protein
MGSGTNRSTKDDLFSLDQSPASKSVSQNEKNSLPLQADEPARERPPTYQLPSNLPNALRHLDDDQLERLLSAVNVELERRGKKAPIRQRIERKPRAEDGVPPLAFGKLNAIRAAFKAGVKPSAIAKQFGVSQTDVQRALKNDDSRR